MIPELFVPVEPMGPKYGPVDLNDEEVSESAKGELEKLIIAGGGVLACEIKEDGFRCQPHVDGKKMKLFTRGLSEFEPQCLPEVVDALASLKLKGTILDAELIGKSGGFEGFVAIHKRARYAGRISDKSIKEYLKTSEELPLELVVFDVLMHRGLSCLDLSYAARRELVEGISLKGNKRIRASMKGNVMVPDDIIEMYRHRIQGEGREGLVLKQPCLEYIPGDKNNWIKLKKFEPLDLVVVGLSKGDETRTTLYGQAMVASYHAGKNVYQTIGSVSLLRENELTNKVFADDVGAVVKRYVQDVQPENVEFGKKLPDVYIAPEKSVVLEVRTMNFNTGFSKDYACSVDGKQKFSLRIAYTRWIRDDKRPEQATTTEQIAALQNIQH